MGSTDHTIGAKINRRAWLARSGAFVAAALPIGALGYWALLVGRAGQPVRRPPRRMLVGSAVQLSRQATTEVGLADGSVVRLQAPAQPGGPWLALEDQCPHLGCRLAWDRARNEYVCPCHAGRFDRWGEPLAGPPQAASLAMRRATVLLEQGLVYLVVPAPEPSGFSATGGSSRGWTAARRERSG